MSTLSESNLSLFKRSFFSRSLVPFETEIYLQGKYWQHLHKWKLLDFLGGNIQLTFTWIVLAAITLKPLHRLLWKGWNDVFLKKIEDSYVISLNNNLTIPISTVTMKFPMHSNEVEYSKKKLCKTNLLFSMRWSDENY